MNRRKFLSRSAAWISITLGYARHAFSQNKEVVLTLRASESGRSVPVNFTGLSYELAQLAEPSFFNERHNDLVAMFRRLSPSGILRVGGNSSEFCWFRASAETVAPKLHVPAGNLSNNWMPHRLFEITPTAIDALAGFLRATGWTAIYGLNFGNSSPERAAVEAAYVRKTLGDRLAFFQIGNEPDFYHEANNGTRPTSWGFSDYVREWLGFADAILQRVPDARFGGPDTGASSDWVVRFGEGVAPKLGKRLVALTGHYYAEGPPNDPRVTTQRLLAGDPSVVTSTEAIVHAADQYDLVYHMTEGNSCYRGGKPGMSNAFASALWAGDYLLALASLGCGGVNLHGGQSHFLSASLGDHNPGLRSAGDHRQAVSNGFYTPIRSEPGEVSFAQPIYYGMLLAQQFAGATMLKVDPLPLAEVTAYAGVRDDRRLVALFNKSASTDVTVMLRAGVAVRRASAWELSGPALDATSGVTLGGSSVSGDGGWHPRGNPLPVSQNEVRVRLAAASGLLVFLEG